MHGPRNEGNSSGVGGARITDDSGSGWDPPGDTLLAIAIPTRGETNRTENEAGCSVVGRDAVRSPQRAYVTIAAVNDPAHIDRILERAWLYFGRGQYVECITQARKALSADPQHEQALYLVGFSALLREDEALAAETSDALLAVAPESGAAHELMGFVCQTFQKDPIRAETHFREAIRLEPEEPAFRATLGLFLGDRGRIEEGITVARKGLSIDPESSRVLQALQTLYRLNDEPDMSERMGAEALRLDPERAEHHLEVGLHLLTGRNRGAARSSLLESLRLAPADADNKDVIAHERVRTHAFFKRGYFLSLKPSILIPALLVPAFWFGLSLVFRPFVYLGWAAVAVLVVAYGYHGLFLLCRRHVRRGLERGRV